MSDSQCSQNCYGNSSDAADEVRLLFLSQENNHSTGIMHLRPKKWPKSILISSAAFDLILGAVLGAVIYPQGTQCNRGAGFFEIVTEN